MMRKLTIISIILIGCTFKAYPNMNPLYTQFMTNPYLINPALAGTYPYYQVMLNSRLQWVGFNNAPLTNVISMYGPTVNQPMGLGGYIMQDVADAISTTTLNLSYAYNYGITEDLKISMGLGLGVKQYKIDGTKLNINDNNDQAFTEGVIYKNIKPDATLGLYLYSATYHGGIAVTNLFGNTLNFEDDTIKGLNRLKQHYYIHGGYKYLVNRELSIEPTIIFRKVTAIPLQMDLNVRVWYGKRQWDKTKIWGGISFRTGDAINILVGVTLKRKIEIGYSYDIGINKLRSYHSGSHEIMIGFKFNDIKEY
jgi:type IX secretion system PorP/SprF family membrane protein